jgi:hypothetical protein
VTVPVGQGQSIIVLTGQWSNNSPSGGIVPTMAPGNLTPIIDQAQGIVDQKSPPVYGQMYAAFNLPAGNYTVTPPAEGGTPGDGTMFVVVVNGISGFRPGSPAQVWNTGKALPGVQIASGTGVQSGDLVVALGGYDDEVVPTPPTANISDPPAGWISLGANQDASLYPPTQASWKVAGVGGSQSIGWNWTDPTANVVFALIASFVPAD